MASFLRMGFNSLKAAATSRRQFTFYHSVPRNSWYSFYRPRKDERLSRPWSHPVVLNTGPLDWKSSALIAAYFTQSEFAPILQDFHLRNALFHQHSVPIHTDFIPQSEKRQTNLYNIQKTGSNWGLNQRLCGDDWTLHRCIVIS